MKDMYVWCRTAALEPTMNPYWFWNISWTHTCPGTNHESISVLEPNRNPSWFWNRLWPHNRSWNISWTHYAPGTDHEPISVLRPVVNSYLPWNIAWTHICPGVYHVRIHIMNPYRAWNQSLIHTGPGTDPYPVNPHLTWNWYCTHSYSETALGFIYFLDFPVPGTVPDLD